MSLDITKKICIEKDGEILAAYDVCQIERAIVADVFKVLGNEEPCKTLAIAVGYDHKNWKLFVMHLMIGQKER